MRNRREFAPALLRLLSEGAFSHALFCLRTEASAGRQDVSWEKKGSLGQKVNGDNHAGVEVRTASLRIPHVRHCKEQPAPHLHWPGLKQWQRCNTSIRSTILRSPGCCKAATARHRRFALAHESAIYARNDPGWSAFMTGRHIVRGTPRSGPFSPNGFPPFPRVPAVRDHRPVRLIHASRLYSDAGRQWSVDMPGSPASRTAYGSDERLPSLL
ncbi:hypothetical protein MRX96_026219 [Rhipicephalus microplus]